MTEAEIAQIKKEKNNAEFNREFIKRVDEEWQEIQKIFGRCRCDLSKIRIARRI